MKCLSLLLAGVLGVVGFCSAEELISTDFTAAYRPLDQLKQQLAENGLTVVGTHAVNGNEKYTSVMYTSADLQSMGAESGRGFISVLRMLHNAEAQEIKVSNPEYFVRAFFQKDYQDGMEAPVMQALKAALGELEPTDDQLSAKKLSKYHFMMSMPYYDDFERVAEGSIDELMKKLKSNAGERLVFKLDIKGDGSSMLCGVGLPDGIEQFNEKLGTMGQSHLLPYMVLIENDEAHILHAKYYLAVSFPQLTMTEFMKIMSVPGDIKDAFKADFE